MTAIWPEIKLGLVTQTIVPQRDKPTDLTGAIPWLRIEDFDGKHLYSSKSGQGVSPDQVAAMPLRVFPRGTVVTSCSCTMGATAIAGNDLITNQTFIGLVPRQELISSDFLYYLMKAKSDELQAQATGAIQQYLSKDDFRQIRFRIPPLSEQQAITVYLDHETAELDAFITDQRELVGLLKERRAVVISQAVTKGLNLGAPMKDSGVAWLGRCPIHWAVMRATRLGRVFGSEAIGEEQINFTEGVPFLKVSSLSRSNFEPNPFSWFIKDRGVAAKSDFLVFPKRGAAIFTNKVNIIRQPAVLDPNLMGSKLNHSCNLTYFAYALQLLRLEEIADVSTIPQINTKHVSSLRLPLPPITEQREIVDYVDRETAEINAAIADAKEAIELSKERRAALISAAVTGKIDVRDHPAAKGTA